MHPADTVLLSRSYKGKVNFVKDGDIFDLGGTQIEVSHMPTHTPGSIVLLDRKAGICYSGDAFRFESCMAATKTALSNANLCEFVP